MGGRVAVITFFACSRDTHGSGSQLMSHLSSMRARKARLSLHLSSNVRLGLWLVSLLLFLFGVWLLVEYGFGWSLVGLSAVPLLVVAWWHHELHQLPPGAGKEPLERLESTVLGRLKHEHAQAAVQAAYQTNGGQFMAVRLGLSPSFMTDMVPSDKNSQEALWRIADEIRETQKDQLITGATIVAAAVAVTPALQQVLPHLQLDQKDVRAGSHWYSRLNELIAEYKRPKRTGGIARDWSFGYTPLLDRYGRNVSMQAAGGVLATHIESHGTALSQLVDTYSTRGKQTVALVGPFGSGKTTIVSAFAERLMDGASRLPAQLKFHQIVMLDAGTLVSIASGRGELEDLINRLMMEAYQAKNIILCLDDAQLFFEEGVGSVNLTNVLLPVLEGGRLKLLLTMDEQRWLQITQRTPALASAVQRIGIESASEEEAVRALQDQLIAIEFERHVTIMYQAIKEAIRLSDRYLHDQALPGKAVTLLAAAAAHADNGVVTAQSVQMAMEQQGGIKVAAISGDEERQKLLNLETYIHERMINQTHAVSVVSDALRRARTGVRNEKRPIGTFLFLGPTGVGKTELAKSLGAVFFGGEDRLVRLDLNEFSQATDVQRLIADGATDPHSLTAQIRKQPFSVVLLDEIEKAHPTVLASLLQALDEGVLRDTNNREVSFRDAIVIATSNAGADTIRAHIDAGEGISSLETSLVDELISSNQFRPEFLNRFDEIVLFRPLNEAELLQVVDLIIADVNRRLALQHISLQLDDGAKKWLVANGNDPRLGARPLRRIVQRKVENLIAKRLLDGSVVAGDTISIVEQDLAD